MRGIKMADYQPETRYYYSALTRLRSVSTSRRAALLSDEVDLPALVRGSRPVGMDSNLLEALRDLDLERCAREDREEEADGVRILAYPDPEYPSSLRDLPDPPPALYARGCLDPLRRPALAVVGSRLSTVYGKNVAQSLAGDLALAGMTIVSGLARGIDTAAHTGSLAAPGRAVAVLGSGIDRLYPSENRDLARRILDSGGLILSEFPPGTPPLPGNFPVRNRVVAGLSWGVLVVEATEKSGALITARLGLEANRELFAVPHNITSGTGIGPNTLIRGGARLVQRAEDVLDELPGYLRERLGPASRAEEKPRESVMGAEADALLTHLRFDEGVGVDDLSISTGLEMSRLVPLLLELQMAGLCVELPGMRYARKGASER
jgi:DNA processing protein